MSACPDVRNVLPPITATGLAASVALFLAMREPVTTTSSIASVCAMASVLSSVVAHTAPIARTNIFFIVAPL